MTAAEIAEVKTRFQAGTHTDSDFRALLGHAETTPSIGETIQLLKEAEAYWDGAIMATNEETGAYPIRFAVGGPDWAGQMSREQEAIEAGRRG